VSIAPSPARVYLPKLRNPPSTILAYLCDRFPRIRPEVWVARIHESKVLTDDTAVTVNTPYRYGITVSYRREVETEVEIPFQEQIVFQNDHLLVADKPHFLPVTPAGPLVNECLLYRLQVHTGIADLAPLHRLDRDTAGLVLFSTVKAERSLYHRLFAERKVVRKYLAVAAVTEALISDGRREWLVENRLGPGEPWFRMKIMAGPVNARTQIFLKQVHGNRGLFELLPTTGKKHQLRIHLMTIGFPILNDPFYPEMQVPPAEKYSRPLQLLAASLRFKDPISANVLSLESNQRLAGWE
jgi:tRNA pseudouridine32 synthase / 23S rRNA pseudouridine746 synthase